MKAVLEEIESGVVCFIPDDNSKAIYSQLEDLPVEKKNIKIGKLYELTLSDGGRISHMKPLNKETNERLKRMKRKRQELLKRNRDTQ